MKQTIASYHGRVWSTGNGNWNDVVIVVFDSGLRVDMGPLDSWFSDVRAAGDFSIAHA